MAKSSNKGAKIGRNKVSCEAYRREDTARKNAVLRQEKHLRTAEKFKARRVKFGLDPAPASA